MSLGHFFIGLAGLAACTSTHVAPLPMTEQVRAEIMPSFEAMQAAANIHDAVAHVGYIARDPGVIFVAGDHRTVGWQAIFDQQRKWWAGGTMSPSSPSESPYKVTEGPDFIVLDKGSALVSFMLDAPKTEPDGNQVERTLAVTQLWQKRPEGWRVTYVHESVTLKPPKR